MTSSTRIPVVSRFRCFGDSRAMFRNPVQVLSSYNEIFGDTFRLYLGGLKEAIVTIDPGHSARVKDQCGELPKIRNSSKADGPLPGERSSHDPRRSLAHAAASHPERLRSNATRCAVLNHAGLPCRVPAGFRQTGPSRPRRYL